MRRKILLCDLVGTVYSSEGVIPGAVEAIARLRNQGHRFRFLTNTDSKSTANLLGELVKQGVNAEPDELFTPVTAATALIGAQPGARVLAITTPEVADQLGAILEVASDLSGPATHVVVGDVRQTLNYDLLNLAYGALVAGAALVALQREPYFRADGRRNIDTGAVVAALEFASGKTATVVGKPNPMFLSLALRSLGGRVDKNDVWIVGDDRLTDIAGGQAAGIHTVLVRTGKYLDQLNIVDAAEPDVVIDSLANLPDLVEHV